MMSHIIKVKCSMCKETSLQTEILSSSYMDMCRDLDGRLSGSIAEMSTWVQGCPYCGYCARNIEEEGHLAKKIIESDEYKKIIETADFPINSPKRHVLHTRSFRDETTLRYPYEMFGTLSTMFLCSAMIMEKENKPLEAGWAYLKAAWDCDDSGSDSSAIDCRKNAIRIFLQCFREERIYEKDALSGSDELLIADLYRRIGDYQACEEWAEKGIAKTNDNGLKKLLEYEINLAKTHDSFRHSAKEISWFDWIS